MTIFAKIIAGEIDCYKVYEDEQTLAFLDAYPHGKGHTLVVPKQAVQTLDELSEQQASALMSAVMRTMKILKEKLSPDGFNIGWNHGKAAGQAVFHLHIHIIPRYKGDGGGSFHDIINNPGPSVEEVAALLK